MLRSPQIDLPLPLRRSGPNTLSSGVNFRVAHEVLSCAFNLIYYFSYQNLPKSLKITLSAVLYPFEPLQI
jgi:hypothetical protein